MKNIKKCFFSCGGNELLEQGMSSVEIDAEGSAGSHMTPCVYVCVCVCVCVCGVVYVFCNKHVCTCVSDCDCMWCFCLFVY